MCSSSRFSNIIATTRLLQHFTSKNITKLKVCIFEQLGCENEVDFICTSLNALYKTMSVESTLNIKKKAIEIGDSQIISNVNNNSNTSRNTLCNYIQQQYNDRLSQLHSDIIDYFGTFLSKKESIEFGYLNKQLYIEIQKQSYLLKRCKDEMFYLRDNNLKRLMSTNGNAFNYSFLTDLHLGVTEDQMQCVSNIIYFNSFFRRINKLHCGNLVSLSCVPIAPVFKCNNNFFSNQDSKDKIEELIIEEKFYNQFESDSTIRNMNTFISKFSEYANNHQRMRRIGLLTLKLDGWYRDAKSCTIVAKNILLTCARNCDKICMVKGLMEITSMDEMTGIFDQGVEELYLGDVARIEFKLNKNINDKKKEKLGKLNTLGYVLDGYTVAAAPNDWCCNTNEILTWFDRFSMRRFIKDYVLEWQPMFSRYSDDYIINQSFGIFDRLFLQDTDKHPLLERIKIRLKDKTDLCGFGRLLMHFNKNYEKIFIKKLCLENFESIEIEFDELNVAYSGNAKMRKYIPQGEGIYNKNELIFGEKRKQKYSIDATMIKYSKNKEGIKYFGRIYQNILDWLQRIQKQCDESDESSLANAIKGKKVVFFLN